MDLLNITPSINRNELNTADNTIVFRCPTCRKLYSAFTQDFMGKAPEFECQNCSEVFSVQEEASLFDAGFACPSCLSPQKPGSEECATCGTFFKNWRTGDRLAQEDVLLGGTPDLARAWEYVLGDWSSEKLHQTFIAHCTRISRLPFAAYKYSLILSASPGEPIAMRMHSRVDALNQLSFIEAAYTEGRINWTRNRAQIQRLFTVFMLAFSATVVAILSLV